VDEDRDGSSRYLGMSIRATDTAVNTLDKSDFRTKIFGEILCGKSPAKAGHSAYDCVVRTFKAFGAKGE
jgi:hypothetical protein